MIRVKSYCVIGLLAGLFSGLSPNWSHAGGYILITNTGIPYRWDPAAPVPFNPDRGSLGTLSNAQAVLLINDSFGHWTTAEIPTSSLSFNNAGQLSIDVSTADDFFTFVGVIDGISPVIFDADGSLLEDLGADPSSVIGSTGRGEVFRTVAPFHILENFSIFNGRFIDGDQDNGELEVDEMAGTITHEFGHFVNLDHSQINGHFELGDRNDPGFALYAGDPPLTSVALMFPFILTGQTDVPIRDDRSAISWLYPAVGFPAGTATIQGSVFESNGVKPFQGANIIVRNQADPFNDAFSMVSGALYAPGFANPAGGSPDPALEGSYFVTGLTPGASYTVEMVKVNSDFTAGSRVGPVDPPAVIPAEEFWNGANETGDDTDDPSDFTVVTATDTVSDINIILNKAPITHELNNFTEPVNTIASVQSLISSSTTPNGPNDYAAVKFSVPASVDTPFTIRVGNFHNNDRNTVWPRMLVTAADAQGNPDLANPIAERPSVAGQDTSELIRVFNVEHSVTEDLFLVVQFPPGETLTGIAQGGGPGIGGNAEFEIGLQDYFSGSLYSTDGVNFHETVTTMGMGDVDVINWAMNLVIPENPKLDDLEPNDDLANATPISYGETLKGSLDPFGELDFFAFSGTAGDTIQTDVSALSIGSELDALITLLDAAGDTIVDHDDRIIGIMQDPLLQTVLPLTGNYFLVMDSWNRTGENNPVGGVEFFYRLHLDTFSPKFEPNNSPNEATPIDTTAAIAAALDLSRDMDFYSFVAESDVLVTAQLNIGNSTIDPVLTLFDTDGSTILATDRGRSVGFTVTVAGTYFIAVADVDDFGGSDVYYQLTLFLSEPNFLPPTSLTATGAKGTVMLEWDAPVIMEGGPRTLDEAEPNDDPNQAQDLSGTFPVQLSGNAEVSDVGDLALDFTDGSSDDLEDLYRITTQTTGITISLTNLSADLDLWVINQAATNIVQCTVDGIFGDCASRRAGTASEEIDDPTFPPGTYFIAVTIWDPDPLQSTSSYTLTVTNDEAGSGGPMLQSFNIYRSETAGARTNGEVIGNVLNIPSALKSPGGAFDTFTFIDSLLPANTFFYQVTALYDLGESPPSNEAAAVVTSIDDATTELPTDYALNQNYPNPFNPTTVIRYAIPLLHGNELVKLEVYNMLGQKVRTLIDEEKSAGFYTVDWDGKNEQGKPVTSGLYVYRIRAKRFVEVKKMLLLK
jgi:hypothetical protein